ncbi:MAG: Ppx/GppA family phosphatase [Coriobacteriia bacterium]|nr:Ppx/GppA family phosphatase [Coriobacteriia bacterium]
MRVAAIDIGTNSVRCTIVEVPVGGPRKTLDDEKAYTRLGRGLTATGLLSEQAMQDTIDALARMLEIAGQHQVDHVRAVATEAVRSAQNGEEFVRRVFEQLGLMVEVISAEQEARLAYLSAAETVDLSGRSAVVDIGGGSVEIARGTGHHIDFIASLPLGVVVMSERYHTVDPMPKRDRKRLRERARSALAHALGDDFGPVTTLVGSGGTVVTVAALIAASLGIRTDNLQGFVFRRAELIHLLAMLRGTTAEERRAMKGMPESRVDIIQAGAIVLDEIMRAIGVNEIVVNTRGMREGIVIDTVERLQGVVRPFDRMATVREFARTCRADMAHAEQVRSLALALLDRLAERFDVPEHGRPLLEAAALLHDVGYHIAYERHHKHSYHMISYAELPGFSARELRIVAAIARYHRGALPRAKHEAMVGLDKAERQLVVQLAAILRLADGIDRSRGQRVTAMTVDVADGTVIIGLDGEMPLAVEVHGAQRKADLFEHVFDVRVEVRDVRGTACDEEHEGIGRCVQVGSTAR